jgi:hypothetical protein
MYMSLIKRMPKFSADTLLAIVEALRNPDRKVFVICFDDNTAFQLTAVNGMDVAFQPDSFVKVNALTSPAATNLIAAMDYTQFAIVVPSKG